MQRLDLLGQVLLPPAVRRRIQQLAPEVLVVVPDGPLHQLPLEAILLEAILLEAILLKAGDRPRYGLDEFPVSASSSALRDSRAASFFLRLPSSFFILRNSA